MNIVEEGGSAFEPGALARTTDGGRTWNWAPSSPGVIGSLVVATGGALWLAGGPANTGLYVTYDMAQTWRKVYLFAPKEIQPANSPTYDTPTFLDAQHGFEPVTFTGPGFRGATVLFETLDGGRTWRADRMVTNLRNVSGGEILASAVTGPIWFVRTSDSKLLRLGPGDVAQVGIDGRVTTPPGSSEVSSVSPTAGWIITPDGRLENAGSSWSALK